MKAESLHFTGKNGEWFRPVTLDELFELKLRFRESMRIVVGHTEIGIETKFKGMRYQAYVNPTFIPELVSISEVTGGILIGGAVTLSRLGEFLKQAINSKEEHLTRGFRSILQQIQRFSSTQIRNVASVAGNIVTASPISDLNPLFSAFGCKLVLRSASDRSSVRQLFVRDFFLKYRVVDMKPDEIVESLFIPFTDKMEFTCAFKQARRREDDIAIVNAGMRIRFTLADSGAVIEESWLSFGGMAPTTVSAKATQEFLHGRKFDKETLNLSLEKLIQDLPLADNAPGGMIEYRKSLALSFFFKFYLFVVNEISKQGHAEPLSPSELSAISEPGHSLSTGTQDFEIVRNGTSVGVPTPHLSSQLHCTGEAKYTDDIPKHQGELQAALVLSTRPHARIVRIDTEAIRSIPGVVDFIWHKDVPGKNHWGAAVADEEIFAEKEVICVGQIIGLIVAETETSAREAAAVASRDHVIYEDLPAIFTIQEAIAQNSFLSEMHKLEKGDPERAFSECDVVLEGNLQIGGQEHFYMESQSSIVVPLETNEFLVYSSTQAATKTQFTVAKALGIDANRVVCKTKRLGGGFGGKETRNVPFSTAAAIAANKTGRPVRLVLSRDVDMCITGQRHPFYAQYKVGFMRDGRIHALQAQVFNNGGCTLDLSSAVMDRALFHFDNCYHIPHMKISGRCCKTNLPSNTAFRGFGGPQGLFCCENIVERVACTLGLPPNTVRSINFYKENEETHFRQTLSNWTIPRLWTELLQCSDFEERQNQVAQFNAAHQFRKRGLAMLPVKFGIAFNVLFMNQGGALVHVYTDGSVLVTHGGVEMGQGLHVKVAQIAASVLGVPLSKVFISETSTDKIPNSTPTAASMSSDLYGMATQLACEQIMERLKPYYGEDPHAKWEDVVSKAYFDRVNLSAQAFYSIPGIGFDWKTGKGKPFDYFSMGAGCSEVEVDVLTGDFRVLRTDIVMDVGNSINPAIDVGQIEGAFMQGMGLFTIEELVWGDSAHPWVRPGQLFTRGPGAYKIPSADDIPVDFRVHLLKNSPNPRAVQSSKAIGEPPLFFGACVFFAIKNAITAARADKGLSGHFHLDSPATAERIRMACADELTRRVISDEQQHAHYVAKGSF